MKKITAFILVSLFAVCAWAGGVFPQQQNTPQGSFFRVANELNVPVACYVSDRFNYTTFYVAPRSYSLWYPVYGQYHWGCQR